MTAKQKIEQLEDRIVELEKQVRELLARPPVTIQNFPLGPPPVFPVPQFPPIWNPPFFPPMCEAPRNIDQYKYQI